MGSSFIEASLCLKVKQAKFLILLIVQLRQFLALASVSSSVQLLERATIVLKAGYEAEVETGL